MIIATCVGVGSYGLLALSLGLNLVLPYVVTFLCFAGIGFYVIAMFTVMLPPTLSHFQDAPNMASSFLQTFYGIGNVTWPLFYNYGLGSSLYGGMLTLTIGVAFSGLLNILFISPKAQEHEGFLHSLVCNL